MPPSPHDPRGDAALPAMAAVGGLTRRQFLLAATALGLTAGAPASLRADVPAQMQFVGPTEARVFQRLLDVMLPIEGSALLPPARVPVLQTLDAALLATMPPHLLAGLRGGIGYFNDGPKTRHGKPFIDLDDAGATAFCDAWADGAEAPQRALSMGLKKLVSLAYFANPPTWGPLGYDGPVTRRQGIPSLGNQPLPDA